VSFDPSWFSGLAPRVLLVTGAGFQRELIKDAIIARVGAVAGKWILSPEQLALEILRNAGAAPTLISPAGRQEFFRFLFSNRSVLASYPVLRGLKRQDGFFRRLDQAVTACREVVAHEQERDVLEERLQSLELGGARQRHEIAALARALEGWMESIGVADGPRLLALAIQELVSSRAEARVPSILQGRVALFRFQIQDPQALESAFFEELAGLISCRDGMDLFRSEPLSPAWCWNRSHTLHDSAERLASDILQRDWSRQVILIPDTSPDVRLALRRALQDAGIPEFDPRDPQELRISEVFKQVFLVLECIASRWDPARVMSLLSATRSFELERSSLALIQKKLAELGQRPGLNAILRVAMDRLPATVLLRLREWDSAFQGRMSFREFSSAHRLLCEPEFTDSRIRTWLEKFWSDFSEDLARLDLLETRFPLLMWMERIRGRLELASAPVTAVKPADGVRIFRMSQANAVHDGIDLWLLGLPASWLSPPTETDYYLGSRERDQLSLEWSVRSSRAVKDARKRALQGWISKATRIEVLDHTYHLDGSESEPLEGLLLELGAPEGLACENWGAHPRFLESYGLVRNSVPALVELAPIPGGESVRISATALDAMSRCSFLGLPQARWRLLEREQADWELWPRVRGVLMHHAVEQLVRELESGANAAADGAARELIERVWQSTWSGALSRGEVPGWIRSPQLEMQIERQALLVLSKFLEKELEYRSRAGTRCVAAEDEARLSLSWTDPRGRGVEIVGKADRIDEHPEGLFVLDYKTGAQAFKGGDIREKGYRLQLPFYALAARAKFQKPVLGVQLVELTRDARRSVGLFPKRLNGKDHGMLTQLGKTNSGLFDGDPDELWSSLDSRIREVVDGFANGRFEARPVLGSRECTECRARLICGQARREWVEQSGGESGDEGSAE
jgi:RecB family exonuclease